jgi:phosphate-selective porin
MTQKHLCAAVALSFLGIVTSASANGSDDDKKNNTVEQRLLRILKERGVLKADEYEELSKLGAQMRAEEVSTSALLEREIADLAERLQEKKDEAKKATAPETKVSYKVGKGVTINVGEDFQLIMGGREQIRFSYIAPDGSTNAGQDDRATFDVRRARIWFEGYAFDKNLEYKVQFDVAAASLRDAYLDYKFVEEAHIRGGQMKRPFSRQNWTSSGSLEFPDRTAVVERFRSLAGDRDVGFMGWGEFEQKMFEWYAGVFNGEGLNNGTPNQVNLGPAAGGLNTANESNNDSSGLESIARVVFNPLSAPPGYSEVDLERSQEAKLGIGLQYAYNPERRGNPLGIAAGAGGIPAGALAQYQTNTFGVDMAFKYQGFFATAEAYWRGIDTYGRLSNTPGHFQYSSETGWFAQGGYLFGEEKNKGFELAARYGQIDFDENIAPAAGAAGTTKIDDYTIGLSYYFNGHALKIQSAYTYRINQFTGAGPNDYDQIFQIQAQIIF